MASERVETIADINVCICGLENDFNLEFRFTRWLVLKLTLKCLHFSHDLIQHHRQGYIFGRMKVK